MIDVEQDRKRGRHLILFFFLIITGNSWQIKPVKADIRNAVENVSKYLLCSRNLVRGRLGLSNFCQRLSVHSSCREVRDSAGEAQGRLCNFFTRPDVGLNYSHSWLELSHSISTIMLRLNYLTHSASFLPVKSGSNPKCFSLSASFFYETTSSDRFSVCFINSAGHSLFRILFTGRFLTTSGGSLY